jgi:hypothetical protein
MLHCLTEICNDSKAFDQNNNYFSGQGRAAPDNAVQQLALLVNLSNAPPIEIIKFTGDPKDYLRCINRFQDQVLSQPMPESKKLTCLIQHLDGRAKEAVKIYEGMGSGALTEALNVLKSRFGQSYMIVDAYIDSIMQGPIIVNGDSKGLKKLADECESLKKTLKVMYSDSETSSIIKKRKSPPNFQDLTLLPNLFGENIVTNRVLPLGFTSMETPRNPNR